MQLPAEVAMSAFAAAVSFGVAAHAVRYRALAGVPALIAFAVAIGIWAGGSAVQVTATALSAKLFWVNVQYVGISLVPVAILVCACRFTNQDAWITRPRLLALSLPMVLLVALSWTNEWHSLVRQSATLVEVNGVHRLDREWGIAFWAGWAYSNALSVTAVVVLLNAVLRSATIFKRQSIAIVVGTSVPWVGHFLYLTGASSIEPAAWFSATAAALLYAITRNRRLGFEPVARHVLIEVIDDAVIAVDGADRIVDSNHAARRILSPDGVVVGEPVEAGFDSCPALLSWYRGGEATGTVDVDIGDERRVFDARRATVGDGGSDPATILVLRDVTRRVQHERALEERTERLEMVSETIVHDLRNPLSVIKGYAEIGAEDSDPAVLEEIVAASERMESIIDEILTTARDGWEPDSIEPVPLAAAAREAWGTVETGDASLVVRDPGLVVRANPALLANVFENLFRNSVEHGSTSSRPKADDSVEHGSTSPDSQARQDSVEHGSTSSRPKADDSVEHGSTNSQDGSRPDDSVEHSSSSPSAVGGSGDELASADSDGGLRVTVGALASGFYVEDDGPGLPETGGDVFERGVTTNEAGTGFGLAIVNRIADGHGWTLTPTDGTTGGARFEFTGVERPDDAPRAAGSPTGTGENA